MTNELTRHHLDYVSTHVDQTDLVKSFAPRFCPQANLADGYDWLCFPKFNNDDMDNIDAEGFPTIECDFGTWVGIPTLERFYEQDIYPILIWALFSIECSYSDLAKLKAEQSEVSSILSNNGC